MLEWLNATCCKSDSERSFSLMNAQRQKLSNNTIFFARHNKNMLRKAKMGFQLSRKGDPFRLSRSKEKEQEKKK